MNRSIFSPEAVDDLTDIVDYIAAENPAAARRTLDKLRKAVARIAKSPQIGHRREDLCDEALLFWPVASYLIVYRTDKAPIQVVRVLHGARDLQRIFKDMYP